jgi:predicted RNase H-like nuclease (RuvC/YqgF family)
VIENDIAQVKPMIGYGNMREKIRPVDSTLRAVIRGLRKEVEDLKKENTNIKSAVKFTSLKELEIERDHLAEESLRLRLSLEEEQARRNALRA